MARKKRERVRQQAKEVYSKDRSCAIMVSVHAQCCELTAEPGAPR